MPHLARSARVGGSTAGFENDRSDTASPGEGVRLRADALAGDADGSPR